MYHLGRSISRSIDTNKLVATAVELGGVPDNIGRPCRAWKNRVSNEGSCHRAAVFPTELQEWHGVKISVVGNRDGKIHGLPSWR